MKWKTILKRFGLALFLIMFGAESLSSMEKPIQQGLYSIEIDVASTKANGDDWDMYGGAPDLIVKIDGNYLPFEQQCKDTYRCIVTVITNNPEGYIEIYDRDIHNNDLIGKGSCKTERSCFIGRAKIYIHKIEYVARGQIGCSLSAL